MHVEVENAEEDERCQSGGGERMDRLEDNQKPGEIKFLNGYLCQLSLNWKDISLSKGGKTGRR